MGILDTMFLCRSRSYSIYTGDILMGELERMQELLKEDGSGDIYSIVCFLVSKDKVFNYTRILEGNMLRDGTPDTLQFFGDDMMYAFQTAANGDSNE